MRQARLTTSLTALSPLPLYRGPTKQCTYCGRFERSRKLYRSRGAVEREFGRLKNEWAMLPLRVRRIERVRLHVDLTILTKLACRLAHERALAVAA
jgi:hypothetical protein